MISVSHLTKQYQSQVKSGNLFKDFFNRQYTHKVAVDDITFDIGEGELVGFIGPNGAGKTTTMKMLSGILYPSKGTISVLGYTPWEKQQSFLKQIGFVMGQKNQLIWDLPVMDSFALNKSIYEIPDRVYKHNVEELVELLECKDFINQQVKTLSLGQRMRIELIASLLHNPKILFLDEPTIGLDIFAQTTIINFIREYQKAKKATIILTSHYMKDVERLANRILFINHGSIIYDGKLESLMNKYAGKKMVSMKLTKHMSKEQIAKVEKEGAVYTYPELKYPIAKDEMETKLPKLLSLVEYEDLSIEEESLESVIRTLYGETKGE